MLWFASGQEEQRMEHPADWQRVRDANIEAEKLRKGAYLRREMDALGAP